MPSNRKITKTKRSLRDAKQLKRRKAKVIRKKKEVAAKEVLVS